MHALIGSLGRLARNPFSTALTVLVIALALALPTALRLLVLNAQAATGGFSSAIELSVYLAIWPTLESDIQRLRSSQRAAGCSIAQPRIAALSSITISAKPAVSDGTAYNLSGNGSAKERRRKPWFAGLHPKARC